MASNPACRGLEPDGSREALQEKKEKEGVSEGAPGLSMRKNRGSFREHKRARA